MQPPLGASVTEDPVTSLLQAYPTGCLLLRDSLAASGHFLMPWMTAAALNQGHKVVFIAAAYSASKHTAALRKVGAPGVTSQATSSGSSSSSITFVSPATGKATHPATGSRSSGVDSSAAAPQHEEQQQQQQQLPRLRQLYHEVAAAARLLLAAPQQKATMPALQQQQQQPCLTIIVDSVTVLSSLVSDEQQVAAFIHHLMALGDLLQVPSRVILLAAADVAAENLLLAAAAAARADVIADVAPLEGRTAAVDGSLTVTVRQAARTSPWSIYHQLQQQQQQGLGHDNTQQQQQQQPPGWLCPGSSSVWFFRAGDVGVKWLHEVHGKELMA